MPRRSRGGRISFDHPRGDLGQRLQRSVHLSILKNLFCNQALPESEIRKLERRQQRLVERRSVTPLELEGHADAWFARKRTGRGAPVIERLVPTQVLAWLGGHGANLIGSNM